MQTKQFLKSKGFTKATIETYDYIINKITNKLGKQFNEKQLENHLAELNLKPRTYNLYRSIMNFYTKENLNYEITFTKAKIPQSLPTEIPEIEFKDILDATPNIKHKLGLRLMYQSGLRVWETIRLKRHDIDYNNLTMWVRQGKGNKDRQTITPSSLASDLELYCSSINQSNPYVFQNKDHHITARTFQQVLRKATIRLRLHKHITLHDLRHNFAVNLLNKGVDIEIIQKLLGHTSLRTTQIYLQCRKTNLTIIAKML